MRNAQLSIILPFVLASGSASAADEFKKTTRIAPHTALRLSGDGETIEAGVDVIRLPAQAPTKKTIEAADRARKMSDKTIALEKAAEKAQSAWKRVQDLRAPTCNEGVSSIVLRSHWALQVENVVGALREAKKAEEEARIALDSTVPLELTDLGDLEALLEQVRLLGVVTVEREAVPTRESVPSAPARESVSVGGSEDEHSVMQVDGTSQKECVNNITTLKARLQRLVGTATNVAAEVKRESPQTRIEPLKPSSRAVGFRGVYRVVGERDKKTGIATISDSTSQFGLRSDTAVLWGKGAADPLFYQFSGAPGQAMRGYKFFHQWQAGFIAEWTAKRYDYQPLGETEATPVVKHSWKIGGTIALFAVLGKAKSEDAHSGSIVEAEGNYMASELSVRTVQAWLWGPQLRMTFGKTWEPSKAAPIFDLPDPVVAGPLAGENRITEPPTASPEFTALVAVPFQPPGSATSAGLAFGPALRLKTTGMSKLWGQSISARSEFWFYWHTATDEKTSSIARVGVAPFVDRRSFVKGDQVVDDTLFGAMIELRTGANALRLSY